MPKYLKGRTRRLLFVNLFLLENIKFRTWEVYVERLLHVPVGFIYEI